MHDGNQLKHLVDDDDAIIKNNRIVMEIALADGSMIVIRTLDTYHLMEYTSYQSKEGKMQYVVGKPTIILEISLL